MTMFALCDRFKWTPEQVRSMPAVDVADLLYVLETEALVARTKAPAGEG